MVAIIQKYFKMIETSSASTDHFDPYSQERMGTTILAIKFNGGVVVAADTRKFRSERRNFVGIVRCGSRRRQNRLRP